MSSVASPEKPSRLEYRIQPEVEFPNSTPLLAQPEELRKRLADSGYLFFRGVLNTTALQALRCDILELCREHGWLDNSKPLADGIYSSRPFPDYREEYMPLYRKLIKLESFNEFSKSAEIMNLVALLLQGPVISHPRTIARITYPRHYAFTTQPHQDFFYIRGTPATYTAWIPAGDCPRELGGLAILEGSHARGFLPHEPAIGAGNNGVRTDNLGLRWAAADFKLGDFVLFHSHTIHGALDNHTPDRLRLSLDYRYQRADEAIDPSSLKPHAG